MAGSPKIQFVLSRHAEEEMKYRRIARALLESVLQSPEQRLTQMAGKEIFQSRYSLEDGRMYLITAVVNTGRQPPVVITVYRTSKIEKYWRPE